MVSARQLSPLITATNSDTTQRTEFLKEVELLTQLSHAGIQWYLGVCEHNGIF